MLLSLFFLGIKILLLLCIGYAFILISVRGRRKMLINFQEYRLRNVI